MRLEQESERELKLRQTVANLSKEIEQLHDKLTNTTHKMVYKETAAAKLALKLGEMEAEGREENAQTRQTIPHMHKHPKSHDIAKKQGLIEKNSKKRKVVLGSHLPMTAGGDKSNPELSDVSNVVKHMPDLEKETLINRTSDRDFNDGFVLLAGM